MNTQFPTLTEVLLAKEEYEIRMDIANGYSDRLESHLTEAWEASNRATKAWQEYNELFHARNAGITGECETLEKEEICDTPESDEFWDEGQYE